MGLNYGILLFHIGALTNALFAEYYFINFVQLPTEGYFAAFHELGGRYNFLTVWNLIIQGIFFGTCILNDIFGTNELIPVNKPLIRKLCDYLFTTLVLPLGMFIGCAFWFLWFVNRELVFPIAVDEYMPYWFNHQMHTVIIFNVFGQLLLCYNKYPEYSKLNTLHCLIICYVSWIFIVQIVGGVWVYPVLIILSWPLRIAFLACAVAGIYSSYFTGEYIHQFIWDASLKQEMISRLQEFSKNK